MTTTGALAGCRHVPGWEKNFLAALERGQPEKTAMHAAGIGLGNVRNRAAKDEVFKERYEAAKAVGASRKAGSVFG